MSPFIQQCLSRNVVKTLIKSRDPGLDYNKALGGVTALYRSALGASSSEPQIPLPSAEKPRIRPEELTDLEIEQAIMPLFDYFDANLQTLNTYLSDTAKEMVMTRVWKEILVIIEGLLIPPLSDISSEMKPLSDKEVDIVFRWLKVYFFNRLVFLSSVNNLLFFLVFARLLLRQRRRSCISGSSQQPETSRCPLDTIILRLAHVRHSLLLLFL
jgi:hypothetical protein